MAHPSDLYALAERIDAERARERRARLGARAAGEREVAVLLSTAYPALAPVLERDGESVPGPEPFTKAELEATEERLSSIADPDALRRELRRVAQRGRMRVALRELLPPSLGGASFEETARELSQLAIVTVRAALAEAERTVFARYGTPQAADGSPGRIAVLGMGKLGGLELNAGSDIDLICFYDGDEHETASQKSAHEVWTRVVRRMTANLAEVTEDGFAWRVDLRLRPEGALGPLASSLVAAERYYETFGRLWERAALLRARPVAGDRSLGRAVLDALAPFVWTRRVDPSIALAMYELVHRARAELSPAPERDLKLGPGGIREAEFFVQALQLIWGGREPRIRVRSTLIAAARLRAAGLLTEREEQDVCAGYVALRRAEHAVQHATGVQTHSLPRDAADLERLARVLGYDNASALGRALEGHTARVGALLVSLLPAPAKPSPWSDALIALDRSNFERFLEELAAAGMAGLDADRNEELARDLFEMARLHPDGLFGARTRERHRALSDTLLDAVANAADPTQAAQYLRGFASRLHPPGVYTNFLADDPAALRRLITVLGGSAFVGEALAARPELGDDVLFAHASPTPGDARSEVIGTLAATLEPDEEPTEQRVALLRRAKRRITTQVALADLAGEINLRRATLTLSALADASLEVATRFALEVGADGPVRGLAVLAMGKLGGREIGYGSDLDVMFLFDRDADDALDRYSRAARRIIQLIGMPHVEGPGYELDTRLRPSGSHGLLVVSLDAFARYHDVAEHTGEHARGERAATWERLALLRARFAAGDADLGRTAIEVAHRAAYEQGGDLHELGTYVRELRERMERELARERPGRYDLKFGRGGLLDVELTVQLLQLVHGKDARVRTTETARALRALERIGALPPKQARALREGYAFLRRLQQRLRVLNDDSSHLIEERAAGLATLARRMGIRESPSSAAAARLMDKYRAVTERVRRTYEAIVGLPPSAI
jgi:glutamate-ammonia-ligase adenylyltransferase